MLVVTLQRKPLLVAGLVCQHQDEVDQGPDAQTADRDKLEDAGSDLAQVETVYAENTEEEGKQPCHEE